MAWLKLEGTLAPPPPLPRLAANPQPLPNATWRAPSNGKGQGSVTESRDTSNGLTMAASRVHRPVGKAIWHKKWTTLNIQTTTDAQSCTRMWQPCNNNWFCPPVTAHLTHLTLIGDTWLYFLKINTKNNLAT